MSRHKNFDDDVIKFYSKLINIKDEEIELYG